MIYKILFIFVSISIIQVFGEDALLEVFKKIAKNKLSEEFMEVYKTRDKFGESVTLFGLKFYLQKANSSVFFCYEERKNTYEQAIKGFINQADQTVFDIGFRIQKQNIENQHLKRAQSSLRRIVKAMKKYSSQLRTLIKSQELSEATKFIEKTTVTVTFYDIRFTANIIKLQKFSPDVAKKIEGSVQLYKNFREKAKIKSEKFFKNVKNCIEDQQNGSGVFKPEDTFYNHLPSFNNE